MTWSQEALARIGNSEELDITTTKGDGSLRPWVPIWVVCVGDEVFVRTWYYRDTGWYGHAVEAGAARVRVPGVEEAVTVEPTAARQNEVDEAYRAKYARYGSSTLERMTSDEANATTLRLTPA